jgi:DNA-binding NarL/FixJ family response regulator
VIRVLLVDDRAVERAGLKLLLDAERDLQVVGEAESPHEAIFEARTAKPDVILLDAVMSDAAAVDAIGQLLYETPTVKVLVFSRDDDPSYVQQAFAAGASGYASEKTTDAEIIAAVREVAGGGRYLNPALGARVIAAEAGERRRVDDDPLSDREREVLRLLALGHTNKEIAELLHISVRTVESHRSHVMQKLSLSTRAELVQHALASGLLPGGP